MRFVIESEQIGYTLIQQALKDFSKFLNDYVLASGNTLQLSLPGKDYGMWKICVSIELSND